MATGALPGQPTEAALRQLQDGLVSAKAAVPGLKLQRTPATAAGAPFPIRLAGVVEAPPEAGRYDVQQLPLAVTLHEGVVAGGASGALAAAVEVAVTGDELPAALRAAIAARLHAMWLAQGPAPGRLLLVSIWQAARARFGELLSLLPQLLEPYEGSDVAGRTVRRYAILHAAQDSTLEKDERESEGRAEREPQQQAGATVRSGPAIQPPQPPQQQQHGEQWQTLPLQQPPQEGRLDAERAMQALPPILARELAGVQQRYRAGFTLHAATPPPLEPAAAAGDAAAAALSTLALSASPGPAPAPAAQQLQQQQQESEQQEAAACCSVRIVPTDPAWDRAVAVTLYCTLSCQVPAACGATALKPSSTGGAAGGGASSSGSGDAPRPALAASVSVGRPAWCAPQQDAEAPEPSWQWEQQRSHQPERPNHRSACPPPAQLAEQRGGQQARRPRQHQQQQELQLTPLEAEVFDRLLEGTAVSAAAAATPAAGRGPAGRGPVRQAQRLTPLLSLLRHVENHAGPLVQEAREVAAEVAARRAAAAAAPAGRLAPADEAHAEGGTAGSASSSSGSASQYSDDGAGGGYSSASSDTTSSWAGSGDEGDGDTWEGGAGGAAGEGVAGGAGHSDAVLAGGTALQLGGLELEDCDALEMLRLNLQARCSRCGAAGDLTFATDAVAAPVPASAPGSSRNGGVRGGQLEAAGECPGCHQAWHVAVVPKLVHERSNTLAHLRARGCAPADMLPSLLAGQCGRCSSAAAFRAAAMGRWCERTCSQCHTLMRFQFSSVLFAPLGAPHLLQRQGQAGAGQQRRQQQPGGGGGRQAPLEPGQPLPDNGTCRHYRHSYRWLRFPCCGKRFACDMCHEEGTDHEMQWATRMVCGFCSVEQPLDSRCRRCGKKLAASASAPSGRTTRFWEGGKGQRDPSKLDRRDIHRYRNSKFKTRSKKSRRVGAEGKERRERRQQG